MEFSAKQIAEYIQGIIVGDENATVHTFAKIEEGVPGAISFLSNPKYTHYIYDTQSTIVLVNKDFVPEQEVKATLIKVDNAYESLAKLLTLYEMSKPKKTGIDPLAYVAPTAKLGKDVYIAPFACVGDGAEIGDNTSLHPHATVGSATIVHKGVKLDNLIQIAHNVEVGSHTVMASQVGIAGSTKVGEWCMFGGQVGLAGHIKIGDKVGIGAQAGVPGNVKSNEQILGTPAIDAKNFMKSSAVYKKLPEIYTTLNAMQKEIEELKKQLNK